MSATSAAATAAATTSSLSSSPSEYLVVYTSGPIASILRLDTLNDNSDGGDSAVSTRVPAVGTFRHKGSRRVGSVYALLDETDELLTAYAKDLALDPYKDVARVRTSTSARSGTAGQTQLDQHNAAIVTARYLTNVLAALDHECKRDGSHALLRMCLGDILGEWNRVNSSARQR